MSRSPSSSPPPLPAAPFAPGATEGAPGRDLRDELTRLAPGLEIVLSRCLSTREDVRDAVQEVLARCLRAIEQRREIQETLAAFAYGVAMHVVADLRRQHLRATFTDIDVIEVPADAPGTLDLLVAAEDREATREALACLDASDRELLRRCFVRGEKVAAIARALGQPAARIRKRKSRAIERLRELLAHKASHGSIGHPTR